MFCPNCGTEARVTDVFCRRCGRRLPGAAQPAGPSPEAPPVPPVRPPAPPTPSRPQPSEPPRPQPVNESIGDDLAKWLAYLAPLLVILGKLLFSSSGRRFLARIFGD